MGMQNLTDDALKKHLEKEPEENGGIFDLSRAFFVRLRHFALDKRGQ
jgi:hypothetical protein